MNRYNREKFKKCNAEKVDDKQLSLFLNKLPFKKGVQLMFSIWFKTRRGCLFVSCLEKGMHLWAAYDYAFKKEMSQVITMLDDHEWRVSFGKLE